MKRLLLWLADRFAPSERVSPNAWWRRGSERAT